MYRLAYRYCREPGMAEDAVQEISLQVLKHIHRLRRVDRFSSWVNQIVVNSVRQQQRRTRRMVPTILYGGATVDADEPTPFARVAGQQELAVTDSFLRAGRAQDRHLFFELYVRGQSIRSVSEETGLSVSAIKTRVHRARLRLREHFREIGEEAA
jgi:RNA polymerase sigma-70 factor (ECF subfamily)